MTRRNTPLEVEQVEQLALIARLPPHHGESPSLISSNDGITVRQFSRALFQQHRPIADLGSRVTWTYSITSSARARSEGGTARPSAFAVLRLTESTTLVGNSTGRSPGAAPCRILSTKYAPRWKHQRRSTP